MKNKKSITKTLILGICGLIIIGLFAYPLPFYIQKPGSADPLDPIVSVDGGTESEGDMHLVTIRSGKASPIMYLWATITDYYEIIPEKQLLQDITDEEYQQMQLLMMENSQEQSTVVAYEAAEEEITINFNGVYVVAVMEGVPAEDKLETGDVIVAVDGEEIKEADDLTDYVSNKKNAGDSIVLTIEREELIEEVEIELVSLEQLDGKPGIGISLVTDRKVEVDPKLTFETGKTGGPSAGLMFALEIYDQLTEEDITQGYQVCGTGEIDYEGNIGRIGGVDKKIVAADKAGCDIFFVPNEQNSETSNYVQARETADDIQTEMEIVPVDHFNDALGYLQSK
ncbi:PDZ domain-containing protein [Gracilibacillus halotolerans]|uniref:endopeptidase La n=1 Tax=Gracilibacillus halotolerans TaxID=74386 RepID=A0A841RBR4_9BACI|nr:SepM family pheromone-processing serine protease [Gracilibacillus halotolerans]MBB6511340.1 PDZ domain-containing protein [Gracilibacillus halotolerans]